MRIISSLFVALLAMTSVTAKMKANDPHNKFCGKTLCYDLLEVTEAATEDEIKKSYRRLAREYHPDKNPEKSAHRKFEKIAKAYETVGNEESRKQYDFLMKNPNEYWKLYGHKYYFEAAPQANLLLVVALLLVVSSGIHFMMLQQKYEQQIERLVDVCVEGKGPGNGGSKDILAIHNQAKERFVESKDANGRSRKVKNIKKDEEFRNLVKEIIGTVDTGLAPPSVWDTVGIALLKLPLWLVTKFPSQLSSFIKHTVQGQPYSAEEKESMMKKALGDSWDHYSKQDQESLMEHEAWDQDNMKKWLKMKKRR